MPIMFTFHKKSEDENIIIIREMVSMATFKIMSYFDKKWKSFLLHLCIFVHASKAFYSLSIPVTSIKI